jgi:hypothetical protein
MSIKLGNLKNLKSKIVTCLLNKGIIENCHNFQGALITDNTNYLAQPFANIFHTSASYLPTIRQSFATIMASVSQLLHTNSFAYFYAKSSVADPDPDPHVFGPPGSFYSIIKQK